jgi:transcriptional regulator with XRE-family HTH domain
MDRAVEISAFLRSRRGRLSPVEVGLPFDGRIRRVPGLRREEVARLAGMSVDYYMRIEQGRGGTVSAEIIEAIAGALRLDAVERDHLLNLTAAGTTAQQATAPVPQRVRAGLYDLLTVMDQAPTIIMGRRTDILASNALARLLFMDFEQLPAAHRNYARFVLLNPLARELFVDWELLGAQATAMLRLDAGRHPEDRQLSDFVAELMERCPEFPQFWADQQVHQKDQGEIRLHHPVMGETTLQYQTLLVPGEDNQSLCAYYAAPGSPGERAIVRLAASAAGEHSGKVPQG